jgi:hypothetical protein
MSCRELQDGMKNHWDPELIARILADYLNEYPISLVRVSNNVLSCI